jgi:hypothetical protein
MWVKQHIIAVYFPLLDRHLKVKLTPDRQQDFVKEGRKRRQTAA